MTTLLLTEDQALLAASARDVVVAEGGAARLRALRDAGAVHDPALWSRLVELGWPALAWPEAAGGLGLSLAEAAVLLEEAGRGLLPVPLASSVTAAVDPACGAAAGRVVALAWREDARDARLHALRARFDGGRLRGAKRDVLDAGAAEAFLVVARDEAGPVLVRVERADVAVRPRRRVDARDAGDLASEDAPGVVIGGVDVVADALGRLAVALAAEALGGATALFERTCAWLHERHQFGAPIGSFQALQHRVVDLYVRLELARSAVLHAARVPEPRWIDLAARQIGEAFVATGKEAVQLHGGIGMTDECDVGLYLKRALVLQRELEGLADALDGCAIR